MSYLRFPSIAIMCVLFVSLGLGQQPASQMTNADVVELVSMGLSDEIVLDKIGSSETTGFDTSITGLRALKAAKVSDTVIRAMINPHAAGGVAAPGAAKEPKNFDPNDPNSPHDPGIYMYTAERNGARRLVLLEPTDYSQGKTGGYLLSGITYGLTKIKTKAVVLGAHADLRSSDSAAVFYFYFEDSTTSKTFGGSSGPSEYTLLRFDEKKSSRETMTMQTNALGSSSGTDEKANTVFTTTKIRNGMYKVVSSTRLLPGEYCFFPLAGQAGSGGAHRLFAFGIVPAE